MSVTIEWWMLVPAWFAVAFLIIAWNHAAVTLRKRQERWERTRRR